MYPNFCCKLSKIRFTHFRRQSCFEKLGCKTLLLFLNPDPDLSRHLQASLGLSRPLQAYIDLSKPLQASQGLIFLWTNICLRPAHISVPYNRISSASFPQSIQELCTRHIRAQHFIYINFIKELNILQVCREEVLLNRGFFTIGVETCTPVLPPRVLQNKYTMYE